MKYDVFTVLYFIWCRNFTPIGRNLYSAPSRSLLQGGPDPDQVEEKGLKQPVKQRGKDRELETHPQRKSVPVGCQITITFLSDYSLCGIFLSSLSSVSSRYIRLYVIVFYFFLIFASTEALRYSSFPYTRVAYWLIGIIYRNKSWNLRGNCMYDVLVTSLSVLWRKKVKWILSITAWSFGLQCVTNVIIYICRGC